MKTHHRRLVTITALLFVNGCTKPSDTTQNRMFNSKEADLVAEPYKFLFLQSFTPDKEEEFRKKLPYQTIIFKNMIPLSSSPSYRFEIAATGEARIELWEGKPQSRRLKGKLYLTDFARICYALERLGFSEMKATYRSGGTDTATQTVTAISSWTSKTVTESSHGHSAPIEFWMIQALMDSIRLQTKWEPDNEDRRAK